nr:hydantoinase B/oxoprolinase family protein [Streptomyces sp. RTd22]
MVRARAVRGEGDHPGLGRCRAVPGGPGQRMVIRNIGDRPVTHSMFYSRMHHVADGVLGGEPGTPNRVLVNGEPHPQPVGRHDLAPGDVIDIELPSGGGKFPAAERDREAILADLAEGILTPRVPGAPTAGRADGAPRRQGRP